MRKTLDTPSKCWRVVQGIVKDWLDKDKEGGSVKKEEEIETWIEKDYLSPEMVKPFRKTLRYINEKSKENLGEEIEAFEYWTAGPVGIARSNQYIGTEVYGVTDEAVERMRKGPSTEQLDYDDSARWS